MEEQILYDLTIQQEWEEEPIVLNAERELWKGSLFKKLYILTDGSLKYLYNAAKTQLRYQTSFGCPPQHLINKINKQTNWNVSLSSDGCFLAVLQEQNIEIRSSNENEDSCPLIANCAIDRDMFLQWRKIAWNSEANVLAYSDSFGDVKLFDLTGMQKSSINSHGARLPGNLRQATCSMFFLPSKTTERESLLYVTDYHGTLRVYNVSEDGSSAAEKFSFSFSSYHPYGVSSVVCLENLLVVTGNYGAKPYQDCFGSNCSISMWRFLNDFPHLTHVQDRSNALKKLSGKDLLKSFVPYPQKAVAQHFMHSIHESCLSPGNHLLATLHLDGRISLWNVPSLKLHKTWGHQQQPLYMGSRGFGANKKEVEEISRIIHVKWWDDARLVLVSGNGNVMIVSIDNLQNMLGDDAEKFDAQPNLTDAVNGHFLAIECEKSIEDENTKEKDVWQTEDEDESFNTRAKHVLKQVVYFFTEAERFQPPLTKPRILTNIYRLVCFKSTTPEELYARKISLEHYGDALELAMRFNLNTDLVYQQQWKKKKVTKVSINDYLTKIKDRWWVLNESVLRIADDFDAMEQLLKYGLLGTSWEVLKKIDKEDKLCFALKKENEDDVEHEEEKIIQGELSEVQKRICKYRYQLLNFLDRLSTYEVILGGSFKAREKYDCTFFTQFRSCNIVHQAIEYAHDAASYALEDLLSYHWNDLSIHWLPILSHFPETANVKDYEPLIPELGETADEPEIFPWLEKHHRQPDWVENVTSQFLEINQQEDLGAFIYENNADLVAFKNCQTKATLSTWFRKRVHEIDERAKQVQNCLQLTNVAIKRGVKGLSGLHSNLETMEMLIYRVGVDNTINLKQLIEMNHLSKMKLLMSKTENENFIADYKELLAPYLEKIRDKETREDLLHKFIVEIASADLTCPLKLIQSSSAELKEPLIADAGVVMKLAMECIHVCKRDDQLDMAFAIVECLPSRQHGVISRNIERLHVQLDQLELYLNAAEVLTYHNHPKPVSYIAETEVDENATINIIQTLMKNTSVRASTTTPLDWNVLLKHLIKIVTKVYTCLPQQECHVLFTECLLRSACQPIMSLAEELITKSKLSKPPVKKHLTAATYTLNYTQSVEVVLKIAQEYVNAAASYKDESVQLARLCLSMIEDPCEDVEREKDFIDALSILSVFAVSMLPVQVRLCADKLELIDLCLQQNQNNYNKIEKLIALGNLLHICGDDLSQRDGKIHLKVAESAFSNNDHGVTAKQCYRLIEANFCQAWKICWELGKCEDYSNNHTKLHLLTFALTYCPIVCMETILSQRNLINTQIMYEDLSSHLSQEQEEEDGESNSTTHLLFSSLGNANSVMKRWMTSLRDVEEIPTTVEGVNKHSFYDDVTHNLDVAMTPNEEQNLLMLRVQKLSEQRNETEEDTQQGFEELAKATLPKDFMLSLAYSLNLSADSLQKVFEHQRKNVFTYLMSCYCNALQLYCTQHKLALNSVAGVYLTKPLQLINIVLKENANKEELLKSEYGDNLVANITNLSDLIQGQILKDLGRGVDVERFSNDNIYKKETILGLAMSTEEELLNTCFRLADRYDIQRHEVMLSFVEFLFVDSGLKAKEIRELLNKWDVEECLKQQKTEVFDRLKTFIYPEIKGDDHNLLLLFYVLALNCTSPTNVVQDAFTLEQHVKMLKKIKSSCPSLDYKQLVHGGDPLSVVKPSLVESNVHLLSKIVQKIPTSDGSFVSVNKVFVEYAKNQFWSQTQLDWTRRFEACVKVFPKLLPSDFPDLSVDMLFSQQSLDSLTQEIRLNLAKRLLKYVRQQKGHIENNAKNFEDSESLVKGFSEVEKELCKLLEHVEKVIKTSSKYLLQSTNAQKEDFVHRLIATRGQQHSLTQLTSAMFAASETADNIADLLTGHVTNFKMSFQEQLKEALNTAQAIGDNSHFLSLVILVSKNNNKGVVSEDDILLVVRPFCSDVNVSTNVKREVLQLLEEKFRLKEEDVKMLEFFQSEAVVQPRWNVQISSEDLSTNSSRRSLFQKLLAETTISEQTCGLEQLLSAWPPFDDITSYAEEPWYMLIWKQICLQLFDEVMITLDMAAFQQQHLIKCYTCLFEATVEQPLLATKILLHSRQQSCYGLLFSQLQHIYSQNEVEIDDELFDLLLSTNTIPLTPHTPLYTPLFNTLLTKDAHTRGKVVRELRERGMHAEAATLHAHNTRFHASLNTLRQSMVLYEHQH